MNGAAPSAASSSSSSSSRSSRSNWSCALALQPHQFVPQAPVGMQIALQLDAPASHSGRCAPAAAWIRAGLHPGAVRGAVHPRVAAFQLFIHAQACACQIKMPAAASCHPLRRSRCHPPQALWSTRALAPALSSRRRGRRVFPHLRPHLAGAGVFAMQEVIELSVEQAEEAILEGRHRHHFWPSWHTPVAAAPRIRGHGGDQRFMVL